MVRGLFYILFFFIFYYFFKLLLKGLFGQRKQVDKNPEAEELVQDPYCRTYISRRLAIKKRVSGKEVHFCGEECLRNYLKDRRIPGG